MKSTHLLLLTRVKNNEQIKDFNDIEPSKNHESIHIGVAKDGCLGSFVSMFVEVTSSSEIITKSKIPFCNGVEISGKNQETKYLYNIFDIVSAKYNEVKLVTLN